MFNAFAPVVLSIQIAKFELSQYYQRSLPKFPPMYGTSNVGEN